MLRIRSEQLRVFSKARDRAADQALAHYARQRFPTEFDGVSDSTLLELIREIRAFAARYRIVREDNVATFVDLSVMYGRFFHEDRWARDVLLCEQLHGPDKVALLRHRLAAIGVTV